jgi:predicted ribosome quality control (RQC) complex YloA/Tae2 family protein
MRDIFLSISISIVIPLSGEVMKSSLSSFDVFVIVDELRELRGARLNKVYQVGPQELKVALNIKGFGRVELVLEAGRRVHLTEYPRPSPTSPSSFAMALRKHLGNAFLEDVSQVGFDRIVVFKFQKGGNEFSLIVELFGKGNIVLTQEDGRILALLKRQSFRTRELSVGEDYKYPPERPYPFSISPRELECLVKDSKADLVRTLATRLGLGGLYAEELCLKAGMDKTKTEIELEEAEKLIEELEVLRKSMVYRNPCIVYEAETAVDVLPFPLEIYQDKKLKFYDSYNKAIDEYFTHQEIAGIEGRGDDEFQREVAHLEARLEEQRETLEKYIEEERMYKKVGEALFIHLDKLERVLKVLRKARKKYSWKEILDRLDRGKRDFPEAGLVRDVLPREGMVVFDLNGVEARVALDRPASQTAESYYVKSKRSREKAWGVEKAMAETERLIRRVRERGRIPVKGEKKPRKRIKRRRKWFEKFRWFYSRDGYLVLGGRDATLNEVLVKRYMDAEDIFVHADIHGAPAVVIKTGGGEVPKATIEDAFDFAASYSRAWKHCLVAVEVYWVRPEQVSKQAEHGEYLAKGAFIIRGKRNYGKGRVELAIGVRFEGEEVGVIGGPVEAITASSSYAVRVYPGRLKSRETAIAIKEKLMEMVEGEDKSLVASIPVEEIQVFLPPGGCEVRSLSTS